MLKKEESVKFIGKAVLFAALCLVIAGISYIFVPYDQKLILFSDKYFVSFKAFPYTYFMFWFFMFLQAMIMIGIVSLFNNLDDSLNTPFFYWSSKLTTFGYLLMGLTYISRLYYMPKVTSEYLSSSDNVREVIIANGTMEFDKFLMSFGFASIWFLTVAILSIKNNLFNLPIKILNFVCSFGYCIGLVGYFVQARILTTSSSILVIFFPIWAISISRYSKKELTIKSKMEAA